MRPSPVVIIHAPGSSKMPSRADSCSRKRRVPVVFSKKLSGTNRKVAVKKSEVRGSKDEVELDKDSDEVSDKGEAAFVLQTISWTAKRLPMASIIWRHSSLKPP